MLNNITRYKTHSFVSQVEVFQLGLSNVVGRKRITEFPHMPGNSSFYPETKELVQGPHMRNVELAFAERQVHDSDVTTLATFFSKAALKHCDLLKAI